MPKIATVALVDKKTEMLDMQFYVDQHDKVPATSKLGTGLTAYVYRNEKPIWSPQMRSMILIRAEILKLSEPYRQCGLAYRSGPPQEL